MLLSESRTDGDVEDLAAWVQTQRKMYLAKTEDADIIASGSSDIASILKAANYTRSAAFFSEQADHQFDCGVAGAMLPKQAGSATYCYKTIEGITVDSYTDAERAYAIAKNANIYHSVGGVSITEQGVTCEGEYIDVMIGIDWMQARMEEDIFQALTEADKIPFNDVGIGIVVGIIKSVLDRAFRQGIINDDYVIDAPLAADVSAVDKAARTLPDVTFSATLQGAIHFVEVRGTVSL
jgi:hypothetical protein